MQFIFMLFSNSRSCCTNNNRCCGYKNVTIIDKLIFFNQTLYSNYYVLFSQRLLVFYVLIQKLSIIYFFVSIILPCMTMCAVYLIPLVILKLSWLLCSDISSSSIRWIIFECDFLSSSIFFVVRYFSCSFSKNQWISINHLIYHPLYRLFF